MALFSFGKKEEAPAEPAPPPLPPQQAMNNPIDQIAEMRRQGLTNNQIVQALQQQGYDMAQIMDAMSTTDSMGGPEPMAPAMEEQYQPMPSAAPPMQSQDNFEEIAEHIVEEKWSEFSKEVSKMNEWKDSVNSRLDKLEQSMTDAKADLDNLHKAIVSKIGEYDKNLLDVGTEIKAMEKVFQKVLPELTENVSELSRITRNTPKPAAKKKTSRK
jgi:uncharacterized protein YhaN